MSTTQQEIRNVVDAIGWDGLRRERPDLWVIEKARREKSRKWVDQNILGDTYA
jgi:hypothetical protein